MTVAVVLLAAGAGARLDVGQPKAFATLGGRTLLEHAYDNVARHPAVGRVIVTAPALDTGRVAALVPTDTRIIAGGVTRQDSVRVALELLAVDHAVEIVLVHDAARPFVGAEVVDRVLAALGQGADAVVPVLPVTDTIKRVDAAGRVLGTPDRRELRSVQTPQGFRLAALLSAHRYARTAGLRDVSDDAGLVERHGGRVVVVAGSEDAFKITTSRDLRLAALLLAT